MATLSDRVRQRRTALGMTVSQLAHAVQCTTSKYSCSRTASDDRPAVICGGLPKRSA